VDICGLEPVRLIDVNTCGQTAVQDRSKLAQDPAGTMLESND